MNEIVSKFLKELGERFFSRGRGETASLIRISLSLYFLIHLHDIYPVLDILLGKYGIYSTLDPEDHQSWMPHLLLYKFDTPTGLRIWFYCSLVVGLSSLVGFFCRTSWMLVYFSYILFFSRGEHAAYGADLVFLFTGGWLFFLETSRPLSLDYWLKQRKGTAPKNEIELWPLHVFQIQLCIIYFMTGYQKILTPLWRDGSAIYYALHFSQIFKADYAFIFDHKLFLTLVTYSTLIFELFFSVIYLFRPKYRYLVLVIGFFFHFGIWSTMNLKMFFFAMVSTYPCYISAEHISGLLERLKNYSITSKNIEL